MSDPAQTLVIFDLDFTLIDNTYAICNAFNHALDFFRVNRPKKEQIIAKIGIPLKEMFLDYLDGTRAEQAVHVFREFYGMHYFEGVKIIPGTIELLEELHEYQLALLTSKKTEMAVKLLEYYDLKKYFAYILGEQKEIKPKPAPDPIKHILLKFPNIRKAYMIGDHVVDCLAAKEAGINFIGVLTGNTPEKDLRHCAGKDAPILKSIKDIVPSRHLI
ncbi:MAG: HAD family hydrolase [Candidatus Helarchaeota archaeon]|nr:HAD family hydrolase [Candidatus Helarchaeota archaeon]